MSKRPHQYAFTPSGSDVTTEDELTLRSNLSRYGQEHLMQFWPVLSPSEKDELATQICAIDFNDVHVDFERASIAHANCTKLDEKLAPLPSEQVAHVGLREEVISQWRDMGMAHIRSGKVGVVLLAGGQGTRLGSAQPKGMFDIGLPSGKSLYQLQAEGLRRLQSLAFEAVGLNGTGAIPWYIMTSGHTQEETKQFFDAHNSFGLDASNIMFFEQGSMPCVDFDGKILLETPSKIAMAPNGNGGVYKALQKSGMLHDMERRGIEFVHVYCVDNCLVRMADPVFIGYCSLKGCSAGNKVVAKECPTEPVGVLCLCDDKYRVVEYSEISADTAKRRNRDGVLLFNAGNIANHFFTVSFLRKMASEYNKDMLPHIAHKKIPFCTNDPKAAVVAAKGNSVTISASSDYNDVFSCQPNVPNGIKMELFVFDAFLFTDSMAVLEVERQCEFSPLKNAFGATKYTAATAREDLMNEHINRIVAAGGTISHNDDLGPFICEISPLLSYDGEGLFERCNGKVFTSPTLLDI